MLLLELSPANVRVVIITLLLLLVGFLITSCVILFDTWRQNGERSTLAIFLLFAAWLINTIVMIFGFGARLQTETPEQLLLLLFSVAASFVLLLAAAVNFMLTLYCQSLRRFVKNVRKLFYE